MKAVWGVAYKVACGVCLVWLAVVLGVAVHYGWRALVADTFVIPSDSMSPTLLPGDKVRVDKTVFGARLYTSLDFTDGRMESIRTRGRRGLRYNDIVVFNYPVNDKGRIGFKMNYVYVKRVVALPGDTISFVHSRPVNSHYEGVLGLPEAQRRLEETPDSHDTMSIEYLQKCLVKLVNAKNSGYVTKKDIADALRSDYKLINNAE